MADITMWDPFAEMASLRQAMDRMFDDVQPRRLTPNGVGEAYFPVDVYETKDDVVVKASLPGIRPEDIDVSVTGQVLSIKASCEAEKEEQARNYFRRERRTGTFVRQLQLPSEVDSAKADAAFEHGVLRLTLPKTEAVKPKAIKVHTAKMIEGKVS